jgi:hypothetical protein
LRSTLSERRRLHGPLDSFGVEGAGAENFLVVGHHLAVLEGEGVGLLDDVLGREAWRDGLQDGQEFFTLVSSSEAPALLISMCFRWTTM